MGAAIGFAACSASTRSVQRGDDRRVGQSPRLTDFESPAPRGYKLGKPYRIGDRWYTPVHDPAYDRNGIASWYGPDFHGKRTANGERFDMYALTAAHPTLPLPSYAYVTNLGNGRTVLVRINDRGPFIAGRIIDLSVAAAEAIGTRTRGVGHVRVRYAGPAPLDGDTRAERSFLAEQPRFRGARMGLGVTGD